MKKILCIAIIAVMAVAVAQAGEAPGPVGIGYQGVYYGEGYLMNEIALRFAPQPVGGALTFGQMTRDGKDGDGDWDSWLIQGKVLFTLIDRQNSDFYIGGSVGLLWQEYNSGSGSDWSDEYTTWIFGGLAGVEWRFTELPEVGFNFEVGYNVSFENDEHKSSRGTTDKDSIFTGTYVSLGATYYF